MKMNKKEAFAHFGIKQKNERWSWAGITDDNSLVALTIWTDQREYKKGGRFTTSTFNANNEIWKDHLGNQERIQIIQYCINHLDSRFRVIWCVPEDPNVFEGKVKELVYLGDHIRTRVSVCGHDDFIVKVPNVSNQASLTEGHLVRVGWRTDDCRALDVYHG